MQIITKYLAEDGTEFNNKKDCILHEIGEDKDEINKAIILLSKICEERSECNGCPFGLGESDCLFEKTQALGKKT